MSLLYAIENRINVNSEEKRETEWYGKPAKKPVTITGDPVICYIVGGTCYAEARMGGVYDT